MASYNDVSEHKKTKKSPYKMICLFFQRELLYVGESVGFLREGAMWEKGT